MFGWVFSVKDLWGLMIFGPIYQLDLLFHFMMQFSASLSSWSILSWSDSSSLPTTNTIQLRRRSMEVSLFHFGTRWVLLAILKECCPWFLQFWSPVQFYSLQTTFWIWGRNDDCTWEQIERWVPTIWRRTLWKTLGCPWRLRHFLRDSFW